MVRETRHLWVGNLPDNIREDRIREHFKRVQYRMVQKEPSGCRYGRVQSVKLLPRSTKEETGEGTMACTVAFMDIKSASKAHNTEHKVDDRTLTTEYYEPAAIPSSASPQTTTSPYSTSPGSTRFPNGHSSSDEHGPFSERFYERSNNSRVADGEFIRRTGYHDTNRSRNRDRGFRNGPYNVIIDRGSHRTLNNSWSYESGGGSGGGAGAGGRYNSQNETGYATTAAAATAATGVEAGGVGSERRGTSDQSTKKKTKSRSGSRSPSPSGSTSSRSPSRSRSRSSSSSSSSSTSRTSSTSTPKSRRTAANSHLAHSDDRRPLAICVRNLPLRSSDTSLKDGLYHEYKKHGKVTSVKVVGQNSERHAIVCFKKPEDVEKALEVSYDKLFFGCKIDVASYQGFDVEDNDLRPYEAEIDEFHPKATRTLFIGNLEKDTTASDLRKHFDQFGEIIEIDIKNQGNVSLYAFCQYSDIVSVVKAIRKMDGEHLGNNRIKLGFGKSMPTNVVWVDGIVENVNEKYLRMQFDPFGPISKVSIDRDRGQALIFYEQMVGAQSAVSKMRGYSLKGNKIQVDFASRECQQSFYEHLEKQAPPVVDRGEERRDSASRSFDSSRFARYDTPTRPRTSSYSSRSSIAASQVASAIPSPGTPGNVTPRATTTTKSRIGRFNDYYEGGEVNDRHFRSYDEYSQGSAASQDDPYDPDYSYNNHESPMHVDVIESRSAVTATSVDHGTVPYAPPDIRNLQKERVHLLEQLEDCPSSGDEHIVSKKRLKLELLDNAIGTDVIIEANRDHRKVMEVRRLSDVSLKHHSRRPSADSKHSRDLVHDRNTYIPHGICKRRKTGGSDSGSRSHHYDHSGSESVGGSRPGTPLCDERPENFQPSEPRRVPRERNGPLTLPLPRFASQVPGRGSVSVAGIKGQKDIVISSPPAAVTSPRISNPKPTSPVHVPPPASPPPRPPSLSSNSSDSENPPSPSLDERIKSLDEKYEKWSGSRALSAAGGDALAKLDATREKFRLRHKLLDFDLKEVQPSEIVKSVMAKRSVFDEDLKRLENVGEKYEPKDFTLFPRAASIIQGSSVVVPSTIASTIKITSPSLQMSSPRSSGSNMIPAKGLQYPFPSHPPIQPATPTPLQQTPPATPSSIASPTPQIQTASTTTRSTNHGDNRLKSCASVSSDNRLSSKVNVNRSVVLNNSAPIKPSEKNSGNISSDPSANASVTSSNVENKISRTIKQSDKITSRRDSNNGSPRGEIKSRRNSDVGLRRTEDIDKFSDISAENDRKTERGKSEERKKEQQQKEKQRLENEMLERERLEKEQQEKERLEKERLEREKQEREKELEKERLEKEKQEKERTERERLQMEHLEQERMKREEQERLRREKEEAEKERALIEERQRKEKEEAEKKEREQKEKIAEEERQAKRERQARKERHEAEKHEKERRREEEKKNKDDNHEKRKDDYKHRENHGETKHKDNNVNADKLISNNESKYNKQGSKEEKDRASHDVFRKNDSHSDRYNKHSDKDSDYRRKESIKENRDNNAHEKSKEASEVRHISMDTDKPKSDQNKTRDNSTPANVGIKRRLSSQDHFEHMSEAKKPKLHSDHKKISDRRDSKDSTRSDEKLKPKLKNSRSLEEKPYSSEKTSFIRESEEKRKEKDKDRDEKHRNKQKFEKQKSKSKSREKDLRESPTAPTSKELTDKDFLARLELRSTDDVETQKEKRPETKEKRRYDLTDTDTEKREKDDKRNEGKRRDKTGEKNRSRDDQCNRSFEDKNKSQKKDRIRKPTLNSSDNTDSDEPRKHSIFDIVDDEPAYISMYDKVKARSCKNMQKQEEEKRQEKIKAKFSQLKQSRAKREEKKRSTSWDEDSDSDRERNDKSDSKSRRHKMLIVSSDEDFSDFGKSHKKRGVFTDSDSDRTKQHKNELTEASDDDMIERKSSKSSRCVNETSDDDYKNSIKSDLFSMSKMEISSYLDLNLFKVKDEFRNSVEKERKTDKQDNSFDKNDTEIGDSKPPLSEIKTEKMNNRHSYPDHSSADESTEFKKEKLKKHKKKQKRLKHSLSSEDSNKFDLTDSPQNDSSEKTKHHDKKKQHSKKDKKRDKSKERDKSKKSKRSKSASKNDFKHDGKMENIFGSLSDSSENGMRENEISDTKMNNSFMKEFNNENIPNRYSDSEGEKEKSAKIDENDPKEDQKVKKRKERKRKEKERLLQEAAAAAALAEAAVHFNENSMDFADMGKQLEANIKDEPVNQNENSVEKNDVTDQKEDLFKYYDNTLYQDFKKEEKKEGREKKKKRKKSKEERQKHHHHHHHHHHEKNKVKSENKKETIISSKEEPCTPTIHESKTQSQSLPNLLDIPSPPQEKPSLRVEIACPVKIEPVDVPTTQQQTSSVPQQPQVQAQTSPISSKEKKRDKFIPGFGPGIDETIHENAVKSISDLDAIKPPECPKIEDVKLEKVEEPPEEKPRAVISQEETEDAVAALLGESFSSEFGKHYSEDDLSNTNDDPTTALVEEPTVQDDEEMRQAVQSLGAPDIEIKPETPQSEHELQIDTDTEEQDEISIRFDQQPKTPDMSELLQPPKTPDIPTYYRPEESKLTPSPLVIKATPANIGSPPSLAPITQQPPIITNAKRNLDKVEVPSKIPPLPLPPLIEPSRTVIHPWSSKADEIVSKVESKMTVVTKVTSPQVQSNLVSTPTTVITNSALRTSVVKISEPSYPPLTAISKPETTTTKADVPLTAIPILQVASPALHNLPARSPLQQASPSNSSQDLSTSRAATSISKIRLPLTSVMVSKPLQPTTMNLPQPKVAYSSEPPKLIPVQEARQRMLFQNTGMPKSFPFNPNQKMLVQTNIPVARGLLVPARPGHFNYIPSQVAFNANIGDKASETSKPSTAQVPITVGQGSPTKIIQVKPQSIIISPNSHISPVINNQKIIKSLPDNPPSLVALSAAPETSSAILSSTNQTNVIATNTIVDKNLPEIKKEPEEEVQPETPRVEETTPVSELEDEKAPLQKLEAISDIKSSDDVERVPEQKEEKLEVKVEYEEPKQKLAIETVTDELNQTLTEAMVSDLRKVEVAEAKVEETVVEKVEAKPDVTVENKEEIKPKVERESPTIKEPEKVEEEKTDSESIVSDISKDCSSADMPIKDLLLDGREDKEDSDYWSPKDVNIDSVIKTLCSADELSNHSNDNVSSKEEEDQPKEEENPATPQKEPVETEVKEEETVDTKEPDPKSDTETMEDSVEDEDKEVVSRIATRRGGRGRGRKGRGGIERPGIQTRRAKVQSKEPVTPTKRNTNPRGGRAKVERKISKAESESPADIYEFREDEENRPRLILTIKQSNTNSAAVQSAVVKEVPKEIPPVHSPQKSVEVKEKAEDFNQPSGSTNTRKSKRLQEKDIFRTTVDDTIEDVVKNVVTRSSSLVTRRSTRQPVPVVKAVPETPRKSTRSRRIGRRASEATEETTEEKEKNKSTDEVVPNTLVETPKVEVEKPKDVTTPQVNATVAEKEENKQPQVPVKESTTERPPIGLKAAVLRRIKGEMGQEPMTLIDPVTGLLTPMRECEENKYIPVPGENKPGSNTTTSQPSAVVTSTEVKPIQPTVITSSQQPAPLPAIKQQSKPQSLKAHVLSSQAAQAVVTQQIPSSQKQNAVIVSSAPAALSVENKIITQPSQNLSVNVSMPNFVPAHVSPRTNLTAASSSPKPVTVKQPVSSPSQMYNIISQQMMQMNKSSPPTVIPKGIVSNTPIMNQQSIIKQVHLPKSAMMPKTCHPMHIPSGVPSSVLGKIPSQTMVTNASRLMHGKNMIEPPKVDVTLPNLISVRGLSSLSPQGQPRHHPQSSMPVSGYEASLAETIPHFPPGSVTLRPHDLPPPHYMHPSHVMYQQYLRQSYHFPRSSVVSGGIEKSSDGQEGEEAPVTSPPLELRISNSVGLSLSSRGAAVPHSLHSPHDRATDSPQIGQVYNMPTARMQHYNLNRYYEPAAEPPPAHRPVTSHSSLAALGSDRPPLSHMAALGAPDRPLVSHLPPDRPLGSHLPPDRPLGSHLPPDRPLSGHSALTGHLPLGNPERPSSSHLPPDRPMSSHLTPDRLSGISTPDRPVSAHTMTLGAGLGAAGNLMGAVARHIGVDAPTSQRGLQAATPPHASQVPPQAESLNILLKQYPKMWQGLLALKNDQAAVHMYYVSGNDYVAKCSLPKNTDGSTPPLRIFQRMRLEPPQVEGVARKMQMEKEHCMLLALPCGMDHMDVLKQSNNLTNGFIHYLQQKQAAGIVNVAAPGTTQPPAYVVHIFPTCSFVEENLRRIAPSLLECVSDIAHLLIVITTV
ncbi:protein split ends-like isoform X3 [Coccinella septempunctata]|uniref:protein split ends-like isoform X3 n=1 Tax=Coccinella septempunctata TaxID=41139 RepID=UPI001D06AD54|nr:protein split ends-like isoform X3 [Coccinella septempunctata]